MPLSLGLILGSEGLVNEDVIVIRHAYRAEPAGSPLEGIQADSTDDEILEYTRHQSALSRIFPTTPPAILGGDGARRRDASAPVARG